MPARRHRRRSVAMTVAAQAAGLGRARVHARARHRPRPAPAPACRASAGRWSPCWRAPARRPSPCSSGRSRPRRAARGRPSRWPTRAAHRDPRLRRPAGRGRRPLTREVLRERRVNETVSYPRGELRPFTQRPQPDSAERRSAAVSRAQTAGSTYAFVAPVPRRPGRPAAAAGRGRRPAGRCPAAAPPGRCRSHRVSRSDRCRRCRCPASPTPRARPARPSTGTREVVGQADDERVGGRRVGEVVHRRALDQRHQPAQARRQLRLPVGTDRSASPGRPGSRRPRRAARRPSCSRPAARCSYANGSLVRKPCCTMLPRAATHRSGRARVAGVDLGPLQQPAAGQILHVRGALEVEHAGVGPADVRDGAESGCCAGSYISTTGDRSSGATTAFTRCRPDDLRDLVGVGGAEQHRPGR